MKATGQLFILSVLVSVATSLCLGQTSSSAISGVVKDASQAVVSGASIAATNVDTGITRSSQSDIQGRFRIGQVPPGTYQITVSMAGFSKETRRDVVLIVGQEASINFTLQVGTVEQEVDVSGAAPVVETTTAAVAAAVSQEQLRELPLNGRSFVDLVSLQAGANTPSTGQGRGPNYGSGAQLSVAGARTDANSFMLDGTDMNATSNNTPGSAAGVQLGVDTIREFQVITSNPKAEYGRNAGAIINAVTRSGTNEWHGSAFEFLRNKVLDARNFFDKQSVPPFKRNQFGVTFGGPIKRDKTFFFLGYEGLRQRLNDTHVWFVPTQQARQGIITDANGLVLRTVAVNPKMPPYLNLYPAPNGRNLGGGIGEFINDDSQPTGENYGSARIDHSFSSKDFFFSRYTTSRGESETVLNLLSNQVFDTSNHYWTAQEDHIFSATLLNTFRAGYNRSLTDVAATNVPGAPVSLGYVPGRPIGELGVGGLSTLGPGGITALVQKQHAFQFEDNLTYTRGAHTMKFGAMAERFRWNTDQPAFIQGQIVFSNVDNLVQAGPTGTSATLLLPQSSTYRAIRSTLLGFYGQDDYRITPNLMLNFGLRWEFTTGLKENNGRLSWLRRGPLLSNNSDLVTGEMYQNRIRNFEPRIGFNWSLDNDQKTVLSGGFGVFHNQILHNAMVSYRAQLPFYFRGTFPNLNAVATFPDIQAMIASVASFRVTRHFDHDNFKTPTFYRFNLGIQRQLSGGMALRVAYVGATGFHMAREQNLNVFPAPVKQADGSLLFPCGPAVSPTCPNPVPQFINPNFDNIPFMTSDSNSEYSSMVVTLQKRFSQGLTFQTSYTYSKCIDDFSNSETNFVGLGRTAQYGPDRKLDRGRCLFNIPHSFVGNWVYELPFGVGKRWLNSGGVANGILGGWQIGGIVTLQQGVPFTVLSTAKYTGFAFSANRPNLKPGIDVNSLTGGPPDRFFDTSAFTVPAAGTLGNAARGLLLGPNLQTVNFTLSKTFSLTERTRLQFRSEYFNLFNRANFSIPNATVFTSPTAGVSPSAGRVTNTATSSRQIQFGLKLTF